MTNRIGPVDQSSISKLGGKVDESGSSSRVATEKGNEAAQPGRSAADGDTVKLTDSAKMLERLEKTLGSLPAVDAQRVSEIKTAIENGDYEIDADAIADAMILFERSLGE
jgi:negative regulator of flagellin synthesis FlgM